MNGHDLPVPVRHKFFTPGVWMLLGMAAAMAGAAVYRFVFGLQAATNLDQEHPWGIWIAIDVATGVAMAAGGYTTAAQAHIFHREQYHAVTRPALLTAMLGYTFVGIGLMFDLGRPYNIWHPMILWQGNSVLFEVGICVMCYLTVLYIEFLPIVCDRFQGDLRFPKLSRLCTFLNRTLDRVMFVFIIAGVVLSCLHQSSLGNLMVLAPSKVHDLWDTPILALLFLLSAFMVGFPMVIFESMLAARSFKLKPEMEILGPLAKYVVFFTGLYLAFKLGDMMVRESYTLLWDGSVQSYCFAAEMLLGLLVPFGMLLSEKVRQTPGLLFAAATLIVLGVAFNRINVFLVAYQPPYATTRYFPSLLEIVVTAGLIASLVLVYRALVTYLPVMAHPELSVRKA